MEELTTDGMPADLRLVTNRAADPVDVLLVGRDARSRSPDAQGGPRDRQVGPRQGPCPMGAAADLTEAELIDLLSVLRFDLPRDVVWSRSACG